MRASDIRQQFLDFFAGHSHTIVASSSLVPADDPTLYFTNAGMVQFKNVFLGDEQRSDLRAVTSQKCLRVSGKHNDLEAVGRTPRHHTFFEMLGNFSFGDYFKADAIAYAWELLTQVYGLPADRLVATVYEQDDEAARLWTRFLPAERIFRFGEQDNFWAMGDTGPCGPCSEIYYDWHPGRGAPTRADVESDRFWEVWNLVFMQYNRSADGTTAPLAKPSIDTGMGLERITAVLQQQHSNYDTDLFTPILRQIEQLTKNTYQHTDAPADVSMRVFAVFIRSTTFLIADGVLPSNEGRGYVLRRIMRRAIRHGKMLGMEQPFFHQVMPVVIEEMGGAYPDLARQHHFIETIILAEEQRFFDTLANGWAMLQETFSQLRDCAATVVPGDVAFKLYDTFGFPKDLTEDIAAEAGFTVDDAGFAARMEAQRNQARAAWKGSGAAVLPEAYKQLQQQGRQTTFTGYAEESGTAEILAMIRKGTFIANAPTGAQVDIITSQTPCYGEQGGQVGDTGRLLVAGGGATAAGLITDTHKPYPGLISHQVTVTRHELCLGDRVQITVDSDRRDEIRKHHTATHLLHAALRQVLGDHVKQAGSLVEPQRLRFDFAHWAAVMPDQLIDVEQAVNRVVQQNRPLVIALQKKEEALAKGAMAFFGEKYGDVVRVVEVPGYSVELCGGTHVRATGEIGAIKILSESSVAAGVRRIEAIAGLAFVGYVQALEQERRVLAGTLKVAPADLVDRVVRLQDQVKQLERQLKETKKGQHAADLLDQVRLQDGIKVLAAAVTGIDPSGLRELADQYRQKLGSGIVALGVVHESKASVVVMVSKDLTDRYNAGVLLRPLCEQLGGKGGGRPDMAQGGGPNIAALPEALAQFRC